MNTFDPAKCFNCKWNRDSKCILTTSCRYEAIANSIECTIDPRPSVLHTQSGGDHYLNMPVQPIQFIHANDLDFMSGNIVKYACRHQNKNGAADIRKIIHYAQLILELQYGEPL